MTDTERNRIEAICKVARVKNIEDLSDGFHTFKQLYFQRMMLFAAIVKQNKDKAWKSFRHEDKELCFGGGWFIVGVDTPEGSYTYHYEAKYFDLFDCDILDYGKHWDGHTEKDVTRLLSLTSAEPPYRCVAKIEINKEDIEELVAEKVEEIKEMFESQSGQKKGKWTNNGHCSVCGTHTPFWSMATTYYRSNYCPNCGADMKGEQDGNK